MIDFDATLADPQALKELFLHYLPSALVTLMTGVGCYYGTRFVRAVLGGAWGLAKWVVKEISPEDDDAFLRLMTHLADVKCQWDPASRTLTTGDLKVTFDADPLKYPNCSLTAHRGGYDAFADLGRHEQVRFRDRAVEMAVKTAERDRQTRRSYIDPFSPTTQLCVYNGYQVEVTGATMKNALKRPSARPNVNPTDHEDRGYSL